MNGEEFVNSIRKLVLEKIAIRKTLRFVQDLETAKYFDKKIRHYNMKIDSMFREYMEQ